MRYIALPLIVVAACSSNTSSAPDAAPAVPDVPEFEDATMSLPDAELVDEGLIDAGGDDAAAPDAGYPDSGRSDATAIDGGASPDSGAGRPCINGAEGCACTPDGTQRANCQFSDNICVEWDALGNFATCVTPCESNADCAFSDVGTTCAEVGLSTKICVERAIGRDEVCRGTRIDRTPMRGCEDGLSCILGGVDGQATYEGACAQTCTPSAQAPNGPCSGDFAYCNPAAAVHTSTNGDTRDVGVCSASRNRSGNYCRNGTLSNRCDTRPGAGTFGCLLQGAVGPPGHGVCVESCNLQNPSCESFDPVFGLATCRQFNPNNPNAGVCTFPCSKFPDNCTGAGGRGLGRTCIDTLSLSPMFPLSFCWDIVGPVLSESFGEWNGGMPRPTITGDNCEMAPSGLTRCPDNTTCLAGLCIRGCTIASTPNRPRGGCETGTSTSATCFAFTTNDPSSGICLEP